MRLLSLRAGRSLEIKIGEQPFYLSSTIEEKQPEKVLIENLDTGEKKSFEKWSELAYFIRTSCIYHLAPTDQQLYLMVLGLVIQTLRKPMIPNVYPDRMIFEDKLARLIEEEPLLQKSAKSLG